MNEWCPHLVCCICFLVFRLFRVELLISSGCIRTIQLLLRSNVCLWDKVKLFLFLKFLREINVYMSSKPSRGSSSSVVVQSLVPAASSSSLVTSSLIFLFFDFFDVFTSCLASWAEESLQQKQGQPNPRWLPKIYIRVGWVFSFYCCLFLFTVVCVGLTSTTGCKHPAGLSSALESPPTNIKNRQTLSSNNVNINQKQKNNSVSETPDYSAESTQQEKQEEKRFDDELLTQHWFCQKSLTMTFIKDDFYLPEG